MRLSPISTPPKFRNPRGVEAIKKGGSVANDGLRKKRAYKSKPKKQFTKRPKIKPFSGFESGTITLHLPLETVSEANNTEHWTKKHKRHRTQQRILALLLKPLRSHVNLPARITLTRLAPRKLDKWDNLPMSMKYILDATCAILTGDFRPGRADDDERITVAYDQKSSSEYGVIIEITSSNEPSLEKK